MLRMIALTVLAIQAITAIRFSNELLSINKSKNKSVALSASKRYFRFNAGGLLTVEISDTKKEYSDVHSSFRDTIVIAICNPDGEEVY